MLGTSVMKELNTPSSIYLILTYLSHSLLLSVSAVFHWVIVTVMKATFTETPFNI